MDNKKKNEMGRGWRGLVAGLLFCALFATGFGTVGIGAMKSLTTLLYDAWMARSWQAVPVDVLDSNLRESNDGEGGTLYAVQARYRYEWAGRLYESTRVGLGSGNGGDNLDDWHQAWAARLNAARDGGSALTAWVDPGHPERAVLDPRLRWRQVLFMLPFAILFPLVAAGASYAAWVILRSAAPAARLPETAQQHAPQHNALGLWFIAIFLCLMALPAIGAASTSAAPAWVGLLASLFALMGLVMLWMAVRATRKAWTYRGSFASFRPAAPRAGAAFQASWALPPRAAAHWPVQTPIKLRVAQYRIDDSGSSTSERLAEDFTRHARPHLNPDGSLHLQAQFELPADAPSHDSRRMGEKVAWRLEWLDATEAIVLAVPIPVQANATRTATGTADDSAADRLSPPALGAKLDIPAPATDGAADGAMPSLPAGVRLHEQPDALMLGFSQTGWRWFGVTALVALAFAFTRSAVWLEATLLALALHALSRHWTLAARDDGLVLDRASWLWRRRVGLPASSQRGLYQRLLYTHTTGQTTTALHALWARGVDRGSDLRLTPGLPGNGAVLVAQMLRWALAQRAGRFSAGELRDSPAHLSRPGWGWLLCLLWVAARLSHGG